MIPMPRAGRLGRRTRIRLRPTTAAQAAQALLVAVVVGSATVSSVSLVRETLAQRRAALAAAAATPSINIELGPAPGGGVAVTASGDLFVADARTGLIRRLRARYPFSVVQTQRQPADLFRQRQVGTAVSFDRATDITLAANGDILVADARNNRICRIDAPTGPHHHDRGTGGSGFDGDGRQATLAALNEPSAVAVARNGKPVHRGHREPPRADGRAGVRHDPHGGRRRHAGRRVQARRRRPGHRGLSLRSRAASRWRPTGSLHRRHGPQPDSQGQRSHGPHHHGGRRRDCRCDGRRRSGPARALSAPMGLVLVPVGRTVALYIADSQNGRVRVLRPGWDARNARRHHPVHDAVCAWPTTAGWLYVKDSSLARRHDRRGTVAARRRRACARRGPREVT